MIRDGVVRGDYVSFKSGVNSFEGKIKGGEMDLRSNVNIPSSQPTAKNQDPNEPIVGPPPAGSDPSGDNSDFEGANRTPMALKRSERRTDPFAP